MLHLKLFTKNMTMTSKSVGFLYRGQRHFLWRLQPASNEHNKLSYPLTKDETLFYLENKFEIQSPEKLLKTDRAAFVAKLMGQMKQKTPFTNIPFLSSKEGVSLLSLHQSKESMISLKGGNCVVINSFLKAVLDNLGFKTYHIKGSNYLWRDPLTGHHLAVIVENLSQKGSKHLVDVGNRFQLCTPVSLDFSRVSLEYKGGHAAYRFYQLSHGIIVFCHELKEHDIKSIKFQQIFIEDGKYWEAFITLNTLAEATLSDALEINKVISSEITKDVTGVLNDLMLIGYHGDLRISISCKRCTTVTGNGKMESTRIEDDNQLISMVVKYFPQFSKEEVQNSINNIKQEHKERQTEGSSSL